MRLIPAALLLTLAATPLAGQSRDWSPHDRLIIGDFTRITSVAAAQDRVYITSPSALLVWNPLFRRWEGPFQPDDPNILPRVFISLVDPLDNSLWLARLDGWVHYNPDLRVWDQGAVSTAVREIAFDLDAPGSGLFIRTSAGWMVVPRGGLSAVPASPPSRPLRPLSVQDALQANPTLLSNSSQILLDNRLNQSRYTAAARSFDGLGWYLGTWGSGLLYLSDGAALPDRLTFGLPGSIAGSVLTVPGGVWVATEQDGPQTGPALTFAASDLSEFRWLQGQRAFGYPFHQIRRIRAYGQELWAATDAGAARINPQTGDVQVLDTGRGLPDQLVFDLTIRRGVTAFATGRGVALMRDGSVQRAAPDFADPAYAVALSQDTDTLWVGTGAGVRIAVEGESRLILPGELRTIAALAEPVVALGWVADTLVGVTQDRVIWRDARTRTWWPGPTLSPMLGRLHAFVPDGSGVWVAGERGVGFTLFNAMPIRVLSNPGDLPGEPLDLAIDEQYLWVATRGGLVRFRLDAIRP